MKQQNKNFVLTVHIRGKVKKINVEEIWINENLVRFGFRFKNEIVRAKFIANKFEHKPAHLHAMIANIKFKINLENLSFFGAEKERSELEKFKIYYQILLAYLKQKQQILISSFYNLNSHLKKS